jgi:hypothetical protein
MPQHREGHSDAPQSRYARGIRVLGSFRHFLLAAGARPHRCPSVSAFIRFASKRGWTLESPFIPRTTVAIKRSGTEQMLLIGRAPDADHTDIC